MSPAQIGILTRESITDNVALIKVNKSYKPGLTPLELYDITRGCWKNRIEYVGKNVKSLFKRGESQSVTVLTPLGSTLLPLDDSHTYEEKENHANQIELSLLGKIAETRSDVNPQKKKLLLRRYTGTRIYPLLPKDGQTESVSIRLCQGNPISVEEIFGR